MVYNTLFLLGNHLKIGYTAPPITTPNYSLTFTKSVILFIKCFTYLYNKQEGAWCYNVENASKQH